MPTSAAANSDTVGVVLVEPLVLVRAGLRLLLTSDQHIRILAESAEAEDAIAQVKRFRGWGRVVVLIGTELEGDRDSFWLIRAVRQGFPSMLVVVMGTDLDTVAISRALLVGADGFINKNTDQDRLVAAVLRAADGDIVLEGLPRGALGGLVDGFGSGRAGPVLTDREREVIFLASKGLTARQIARRLGVAERTVTTHLHHIYRKLGANGRVAALSAAARLGLLSGARRPDTDDGIADVVTIA